MIRGIVFATIATAIFIGISYSMKDQNFFLTSLLQLIALFFMYLAYLISNYISKTNKDCPYCGGKRHTAQNHTWKTVDAVCNTCGKSEPIC
jgi:hypothetical protein